MTDERAADQPVKLPAGNEVSGHIAGSSVQAGAIHGGVHFHHASSPAAPIPRQLLTPSPHFINREQELATLDTLLNTTPSVFAILTGPGGVGKTALALRWADQIRTRYPDGQLYVDLAGFSDQDPLDPGEVLGSFLRALGVPPQRVPLDLMEQSALYRSVTAGRSLLVLLDNAFSAAQVRTLLPPLSTSAVLVTSRSRLTGLLTDGALLVEVGPLTTLDSVSLLGRVAGEERITRERDRAEYLIGFCGGLPIAVCLTAARLAARPRMSLSRAAKDFTDAQRRLRTLSFGDGFSVRNLFDVSYRALETPAAALYRRLSLHPGQDFSLDLANAVAEGTVTALSSEDPLGQLVEANLLEELPEDRLRFHDLLRLHAQERAQTDDSEPVRRSALLSMLEWYFAAALKADLVITPYRRRLPYTFESAPTELPVFGDRDTALLWLDRERPNLIGAGRTAFEHGWPELAWHLCDVMWPLLLYRKHYRDRLEVDRRGIQAARTWGNAWAEADMLKRLGLVCTSLGNFDEAETSLQSSMELCRTIEDRIGVAAAQEGRALLHVATERLDKAVDLFNELVELNRQMGQQRGVGLTLINLGKVLPRLSRPQEAVALLNEAHEIFSGLADSDPYNGARVLIAMANAQLSAGSLAEAKESATEAVQRMRDLGSEGGEAEALETLGEIAHGYGDNSLSLRYLRQSLQIFTALGSPHATRLRERVLELGALTGLGDDTARPGADSDHIL